MNQEDQQQQLILEFNKKLKQHQIDLAERKRKREFDQEILFEQDMLVAQYWRAEDSEARVAILKKLQKLPATSALPNSM